jgi:hypothetical protein
MREINQKRLKEGWIVFFLLGVVMISYPFIHIFNKETTVLGIPELVLYLMVGWPISILVIYLFSRNLGDENNSGEDTGKDQG